MIIRGGVIAENRKLTRLRGHQINMGGQTLPWVKKHPSSVTFRSERELSFWRLTLYYSQRADVNKHSEFRAKREELGAFFLAGGLGAGPQNYKNRGQILSLFRKCEQKD